MWEKLIDAAKQILLLTHQTNENKEAIKELRSQMDSMAKVVERLAYEVKRLNERIDNMTDHEAQEREKQILKLENELLKFEKRLPAARPTGRKNKPRKK
jgi:chromosome segregation ATPase